MADFDVTDSFSYLGRTVLVELYNADWDDDVYIVRWRRLRIVGVVLQYPDLPTRPHFLAFDLSEKPRFPDEFFWSDIRTITLLPD